MPEAAYTLIHCAEWNFCKYGSASSIRESCDILTYLARRLDAPIQADSLAAVRDMTAKENIIFANIDEIILTNFIPFKLYVKLLKKGVQKVEMNYYMIDPIIGVSVIMARYTKMKSGNGASS